MIRHRKFQIYYQRLETLVSLQITRISRWIVSNSLRNFLASFFFYTFFMDMLYIWNSNAKKQTTKNKIQFPSNFRLNFRHAGIQTGEVLSRSFWYEVKCHPKQSLTFHRSILFSLTENSPQTKSAHSVIFRIVVYVCMSAVPYNWIVFR